MASGLSYQEARGCLVGPTTCPVSGQFGAGDRKEGRARDHGTQPEPAGWEKPGLGEPSHQAVGTSWTQAAL